MVKKKARVSSKKKASVSVPKSRYIKPIVKKKHEAGWLTVIKIGIVSWVLFVIIALIFGYGKQMSLGRIVTSGIQVAILVIVVIIFIAGLIIISENTANEMNK